MNAMRTALAFLLGMCMVSGAAAQTMPRVPARTLVPLECEDGVRSRMNIIHMRSDTIVMLHWDGQWLDLRQAGEPQANAWTFQDKTGEWRWAMRQREGVLSRNDAVVARCKTALPVEVIMIPSTQG